jgi:hypothetical protein
VHAIVVLGDDPQATALVALGIGRAQARRRRVAVGDLLGEAPPLQSLIEADNPHGLVDSFVYGVSLNKIAYPVANSGELFVMPSGTEPLDYADILPNSRWRRLASGFREVGAMLVLAAPASAERVEELVSATDGAVLVGEMVPRQLPVSQVLAGIRAPRPSAARATPTGTSRPRVVTIPRGRHTVKRALRYALAPVVILALLVIVAWLAFRPLADSPDRSPAARPDTAGRRVPGSVPLVGPTGPTSGASAAAIDTTRPPGAVAGPVANPADSARAAVWAVGFKNFNTAAGVILTLHNARNVLPAATYAPVQQQGARWYQLVAGAYTRRASADSLLAVTRTRRDPELEAVAVIRLPFAFLMHERVADADAGRLVGQLVERGHPAYSLRQTDGTHTVYVGAFESPTQAALLARELESSGLATTLVYRLGRAF